MYLLNEKDIFWAFMDLEKVFDTIDRHGMWQIIDISINGLSTDIGVNIGVIDHDGAQQGTKLK